MEIESLAFISQSVLTIFINILFFQFYAKVYGTKYQNKALYIIACAISTVLMICINQSKNQYINIGYSFISYNIICAILFEFDVRKSWMQNLLFWFIMSSCDIITVLAWSIVKNDTLEGILSDNQQMIISNLFNMLLVFTVYIIYVTIMQKQNMRSIQLKQAIFMSTMTFLEFFTIITYAMEISGRDGGIRIICILMGFILINAYIAYIITQLSDAYRYKYELSIAEHLREMQLANYKEIERKYRESRAAIHDIKKHIQIIENLNDEKREEYTQHIYKQMDNLFSGFHCSNHILSIILSQKISFAQSEGIEVITSVDDIDIDFIDDLDITAIFANLWDNAIEACSKVDNNKFIEFKMYLFKGFIIINMTNSFDGNIVLKNGLPVSTKSQHEGIGLSNIRVSVDKYDGLFVVDNDNMKFKAEITIPIPKNVNK